MKSNWNHIPFSPSKSPFFYGWVVVAAGTIGTIASIPGQTMGVSVFTDALVNSLGISAFWLSAAYMIGTGISSLLLPYAGTLLDRFGARVMIIITSLSLGGSVLLLSVVDRIALVPQLHSTLLAFIVISLCFLLIRFFGQGCMTMASRVMIGKWFNHRRGLATAISGAFVSFGFNAAPRFLNHLVESLGWRSACVVLAALVGGGMSFLGWLLFRDNPEDCGLEMDGFHDPEWRAKMAAKIPETRKEFTRAEALRTVTFWAFNLALASQALIITAFTFHITRIGAEVGIDRTDAFRLFLPMSVFSVASNLILGAWLSDRIKLKWLLMTMMATQGLGTFGLLALKETTGQWLFIAGFGTANGLFALFAVAALPRFFGRKHLGAISGFCTSTLVLASAIGPVLFSGMRYFTGSFKAVLICCIAMSCCLFLLGFRAENPQEHIHPPS